VGGREGGREEEKCVIDVHVKYNELEVVMVEITMMEDGHLDTNVDLIQSNQASNQALINTHIYVRDTQRLEKRFKKNECRDDRKTIK